MRIVPLGDDTIEVFYRAIREDPVKFHYFIHDWTHERERSKIMLAVEGEEVTGMILAYQDRLFQLRSPPELASPLVKAIGFSKGIAYVPEDCVPAFEGFNIHEIRPVIRMLLVRGEEHLRSANEVVRLDESDSDAIWKLFTEADPPEWGNMEKSRAEELAREMTWFGVKEGGELVAAGCCRPTEMGSDIQLLATAPGHRRRGYGTSVVSALVKEILARGPRALIHVYADNIPAKKVYESVGFRPYLDLVSVKCL
jgi:ribosomal protein S18 acetylase RimI-like enzyme